MCAYVCKLTCADKRVQTRRVLPWLNCDAVSVYVYIYWVYAHRGVCAHCMCTVLCTFSGVHSVCTRCVMTDIRLLACEYVSFLIVDILSVIIIKHNYVKKLQMWELFVQMWKCKCENVKVSLWNICYGLLGININITINITMIKYND